MITIEYHMLDHIMENSTGLENLSLLDADAYNSYSTVEKCMRKGKEYYPQLCIR